MYYRLEVFRPSYTQQPHTIPLPVNTLVQSRQCALCFQMFRSLLVSSNYFIDIITLNLTKYYLSTSIG